MTIPSPAATKQGMVRQLMIVTDVYEEDYMLCLIEESGKKWKPIWLAKRALDSTQPDVLVDVWLPIRCLTTDSEGRE